MDRRGFFRLPLAAVIGGTATTAAAGMKFTSDAPRSGEIARAPVGALEVEIDGKTYHLYLWEPRK